MAATSGVELKVRTQNIGNALFGQSGGFFLMEASGQGQLAVSGFGSMFQLNVEPGKDVIIDNLMWSAGMPICTAKFPSPLEAQAAVVWAVCWARINSATSGEGIVLRFSGAGKVYICSRNRKSFIELFTKP